MDAREGGRKTSQTDLDMNSIMEARGGFYMTG